MLVGYTGCCAWLRILHNILCKARGYANLRQAQNERQFEIAVDKAATKINIYYLEDFCKRL
jgi:hypothetical protein